MRASRTRFSRFSENRAFRVRVTAATISTGRMFLECRARLVIRLALGQMFHIPILLPLTIRLILGHVFSVGFGLISQRLFLRLDGFFVQPLGV